MAKAKTYEAHHTAYPSGPTRYAERDLRAMASGYLDGRYRQANPGADEAAVLENSRVKSVGEAVEILEDAGILALANVELRCEVCCGIYWYATVRTENDVTCECEPADDPEAWSGGFAENH